MNQRLIRSLGIAILASLSIGAAVAQAPDKVIVSAAFKSVFYLPAYIAEERGFFKQQGLDVRIDIAGSPTNALAAVISKSADFSLHGPEWTAISSTRGGQVMVVGGTLDGLGAWVTCRPDSKVSRLADLKGKTVASGTMPTTSTSAFMNMMRKSGLEAKKDYTIFEVPVGSEIGPLVAGQVQCAVLYEPGASQGESQGMKVIAAFPNELGTYTFSAISTRKDINPGVARKFVAAVEMALRDIQKNPAGAVASGQKLFPNLDAAVVKASVERLINDKVFAKSVAITPEAMRAALQTQVDLGNLPAIPANESFMNMSWATEAARARP